MSVSEACPAMFQKLSGLFGSVKMLVKLVTGGYSDFLASLGCGNYL